MRAHGGLFTGGDQGFHYNVLNTINHLPDWLSTQSRGQTRLLHCGTTFGMRQWATATCSQLCTGLRAIVCLAPWFPMLHQLLQSFVSRPGRSIDHLKNRNSYMLKVMGSIMDEGPSRVPSFVAMALWGLYSCQGQPSKALDFTRLWLLWVMSPRPLAHPQQ
jgi:hypothetical protein